MGAFFSYPRYHRHKEIITIACEDCGQILHYVPKNYKLKRILELLPAELVPTKPEGKD